MRDAKSCGAIGAIVLAWVTAIAACGGDDTSAISTSGAGGSGGGTGGSKSATGASVGTSGSATGTGGNTGASGSGGATTSGTTGTGGAAGNRGGSAGNAGAAGNAADASSDTATADALDGNALIIMQLCTTVGAAHCAGGPTLDQCIAMFAPYVSCPRIVTCGTCLIGLAPVQCADSGDPDLRACGDLCDHFTTACSDSGTDASASDSQRGSDAAVQCLGTPIVAQASSSNDAAHPQSVPTSGKGVSIFGQNNGTDGYNEPGGFFELTGLAPNQAVAVQIVGPSCNTARCPSDITFTFGAADATPTQVGSSGGTCGSSVARADASGTLILSIGKSGDAGAENGVGVVISPMAADASVADAPSD